MQKHYSYLDIDLDNKNNYRRLSAIQGDIKSRYILVNLYSNNLAYDLSDCTVKIYGLKRDKTIFFNNAVVKNSKLGQFEIELTNQALAVLGELKIQILVLGVAGEKLTSSAFFIDVGESIIDENAIESTNEFGALTESLTKVNEWDKYFEETSGKIEEKYTERLNEVDSQIKDIENLKLPFKFGKIDLPDDFNKLNDFEFYRDGDGIVKTTYNLDNIFKVEKTIYLSEQGKDTNDGLTTSTPLRTLEKAIEVSQAQSENNIAINILNRCFSKGGAGSGLNIPLTKNILIQADKSVGRCFMGSFQRNDSSGLVWNDEGNGTYSYSYEEIPQYILDGSILDYRGIPKELTKSNDNSQLNMSIGTWCVDTVNKKIFIKPYRTFVRENIFNICVNNKNIFLLNNKTLIFRNIDFLYNSNVADESNRGYGGIEVKGGKEGSKFIFDSCSSSYAYKNGIYVDDINYTYVINSTCTNNGADGFNYDGRKNGKPYELIVEYNCHSYDNGRIDSNITQNSTTAHGGVHILRVNSVGYHSNGPICADVQGCYSICIDCHMRDSLLGQTYPGANTDTAFWFDNSNQVTGLGKVILVNCTGINKTGYGLSTDGTIDLIINNFNGKIRDGIHYVYE